MKVRYRSMFFDLYRAARAQAGFTLIEMLIVISIVSLLALTAVFSYGAARQHARFDIAVDSLVSLVREQRQKALTGRQNNLSGSFCNGLLFDINQIGNQIEPVSVPYVAVAGGKADFCDTAALRPMASPEFSSSSSASMSDVAVKSIVIGNTKVAEVIMLLFKPPFGMPVLAIGQGNESALKNLLKVTIGLRGATDERSLTFDAFTGEIEKTL